ncbi:hypothetical protein BHYA_0080g00350 [Botrytis hyacinthi]|uniref:Uncharacterized protein n=1 Tax=Botrytis hyacinthi TaxID=278943 RepID=A0A4Z1GXY8_9HELO|nr:hypothetical protein BHYA_0080g00350 [Botrytis hyacinthi]
MSFPDLLTPPDSARIKVKLPGTMELEESNARAHPENGTIKHCSTLPVEDWTHEKRRRQDLERSHRKANIPKKGYGLTEEQIKIYRESADKFENILAAHATSGAIPYVVDLKITDEQYARLLSSYNSIYDQLPIGDALMAFVESLEFLERWSRLQRPVFSNIKKNTTIDKWNEKIKEQDFALRESSQWGPLYKLYEQWAIYETDFHQSQYQSFDSLSFDFD